MLGDGGGEPEQFGGAIPLVVVSGRVGQEGLGQAVADAGEVVGPVEEFEGGDGLGPVVRGGAALGVPQFGAEPALVGLPDGDVGGDRLGGFPDALEDLGAAGVGERQPDGLGLGDGGGDEQRPGAELGAGAEAGVQDAFEGGAGVEDAALGGGELDLDPLQGLVVLRCHVMGAEVLAGGGQLAAGLGHVTAGEGEFGVDAGVEAAGLGTLAHPLGLGCGLGGLGPAAEGEEGFGEVPPDPGLFVELTELPGEGEPGLQDGHGLAGAADGLQGGGEVHIAAAGDDGDAFGDRPFVDVDEFGEARLDVPRGDHEAGQGEAGVHLDLAGADHVRVLDRALGGDVGVGSRDVDHGPAGDLGEHLRVHFGGRESADEFLCGGEFRPAVAAGLGADQDGALHPEPGGPQRVLLVLQEVQGPLGDLQGALALPAQPTGDGGLRHQVEVAQGCGLGVAAAGRVDLGVVDGAQSRAYGVGDGVPQLHRPLQEP